MGLQLDMVYIMQISREFASMSGGRPAGEPGIPALLPYVWLHHHVDLHVLGRKDNNPLSFPTGNLPRSDTELQCKLLVSHPMV